MSLMIISVSIVLLHCVKTKTKCKILHENNKAKVRKENINTTQESKEDMRNREERKQEESNKTYC